MNPSNRLKTTKYNIFTFLPITFFLQLTKVVNLFFLINGVLQCIPGISTNNPLTTMIPLSFVILLGILKEAVVEIKRFREDRAFNAHFASKLCANNRYENVRLD